MSEPVSAMRKASYTSGISEISEIGPIGMITLRGDLAAKPLRKAAVAAGGVDIPEPRAILTRGDRGIAWMSPDELLILCPYDAAHARLADLCEATAKLHALAVNVSDARAVFDLRGPYAREVLAKLAPVDLAPGRFGPGTIRRTRLAQVPAAFWMTDKTTFRVVCFRSVAQYVFDVLKIAAQPGSEVAVFRS